MSDLKKQLIKLGSTNPELRPHIREVLKASGGDDDFLRVVKDLERLLLRMGFKRSQQLLSSERQADAFGSWEWGNRKTGILIKIIDKGTLLFYATDFYEVHFSAFLDNRVKERWESKPKTLQGLLKAVKKAVNSAEEWTGSFETLNKTASSEMREVTERDMQKFVANVQDMVDVYYAKMGYMTQGANIKYDKGGMKYYRVYREDTYKDVDGNILNVGSKSAFCFVDKATGEVFKPASWKAPAKHARGTIFGRTPREWGVNPLGANYLR